jgi:hypothetical protein
MAKRIFVTDEGDKKCPGCRWDLASGRFYGIGETLQEARERVTFEGVSTVGMCSICMMEILVDKKVLVIDSQEVTGEALTKNLEAMQKLNSGLEVLVIHDGPTVDIFVQNGGVARAVWDEDAVGECLAWYHYPARLRDPVEVYADIWKTLGDPELYERERGVDLEVTTEALRDVTAYLGVDSKSLCVSMLWHPDTTTRVEVVNQFLFGVTRPERWVRAIQCSKCGNWEQMDAEDARWHSQTFEWVRNDGDEAEYKCKCGALVRSSILPADREERGKVLLFASSDGVDMFSQDGRVVSAELSDDSAGAFILWFDYRDSLEAPVKYYADIWVALGEGKLDHREYRETSVTAEQIEDALAVLGYEPQNADVLMLWEPDEISRVAMINQLITIHQFPRRGGA